MKLEYTTEPTETMQIVTPLGTQHAIHIWRPIGERGKPVMVEELPKPPRRTTPRVGVRASIIAYMQDNDSGNTGITSWQIADALGENRKTIGRYLADNPNIFLRSNRTVTATYTVHNGSKRLLRLPLWHLRKEAE